MPQTITDADRKKIYDDLAELMISCIERQELPLSEVKQSAKFILDTLDTIKDEDQMLEFLHTLGERWKLYAIELVRYEGKKQELADVQKMQEIQQKLSNFIQS